MNWRNFDSIHERHQDSQISNNLQQYASVILRCSPRTRSSSLLLALFDANFQLSSLWVTSSGYQISVSNNDSRYRLHGLALSLCKCLAHWTNLVNIACRTGCMFVGLIYVYFVAFNLYSLGTDMPDYDKTLMVSSDHELALL